MKKWLVMLWVSLTLTSCAVGPDYERPAAAAPERYKEAPEGLAEVPPGSQQWWNVFDDSKLNELVSRVEVSNQTLAASEAAYRQAVAVIGQQRAILFPMVTGTLDATRVGGPARDNTITTPGGGSTGFGTRGAETYGAGVNVNWEIDLWGRVRRSLENAQALASASAGDLASAKLSLQAQAATAYLQLREADAQLRLLDDTVVAYTRALQIALNRYNAGVAAKTDVTQAQTQLANAQDQAAALVLQRAQLEHAIAALIGVPAGSFTLEADPDWRTGVPAVPSGIPSELLQRRPDIAAAERRVAAANASIGIEKAAYFPSLTLNGGYQFLSGTISSLFDRANEANSIAASAAQTIFDAGATRARVAGARAAYDQSVADYRQTVIAAFQNVEDQLAAARQLEQQYELRRQASEAADETERLTFNQYRAGQVSYTNVVVAQTAALSARVALAEIVAERQTTVISLIQALGGGWTESELPP